MSSPAAPERYAIPSTVAATGGVHFPNLDALRFFAFFAVFLFHGVYTEVAEVAASSTFSVARALVSGGHLGVNFFFVLSGFLITYLLLKEKEDTGTVAVGAFYMRRVLRIWPLYFACLLYGFVIHPQLQGVLGREPITAADPLLFLFFLSNFFNLYQGLPEAPILPILWSVSVEEQFYLFWPLLFLVGPRRWYPALFGAVVAGSLLFRFAHRGDELALYYHTFSVITDMAVGGLLAYLSFASAGFRRWIAALRRREIAAAYLLGIAIVVFRAELFSGSLLPLQRLVLSLVFGFVILEQNFATRSLFKVGAWRRLSVLGRYTYGLYCLHPLGIIAGVTALGVWGVQGEPWAVLGVQLPIALAVTLILAWASFHLLEQPFLGLRRYFRAGSAPRRPGHGESAPGTGSPTVPLPPTPISGPLQIEGLAPPLPARVLRRRVV
jgi:peptidoglycan/LPS O-acetylase OafA/YrhL